jgi:hypothetical protein
MEYAGIAISSGLLLAASSFVATQKAKEEGTQHRYGQRNEEEAQALFDEHYNEGVKKNEEEVPIFLAHRYTNPYSELQDALKEKGIESHIEGFSLHLNLSEYLETNTFAAERELFKRLVKGKLLLRPGESLGLEKPGTFAVTVPFPGADDVNFILENLNDVLKVTALKPTEEQPDDSELPPQKKARV